MTIEQALSDRYLAYRVAGAAHCSPTTVKKVIRGERPKRIRGPLERVLAALDAEGVDTPERLARLAAERRPMLAVVPEAGKAAQ